MGSGAQSGKESFFPVSPSRANYPRTGKQNSVLINITSHGKKGPRLGTHNVPEAAHTTGLPWKC